MNVILRPFDVETTDMEPPEAEIIEIGMTDVVLDTETKAVKIEPQPHALFGASRPLKPEVRAVHHFSDEEIAGRPLCLVEDLQHIVRWRGPQFLVAHNAAFEAQWFTPEVLGEVRLICTMKAAERIWPEAPGYSLQVLRYWLGLELDDAMAMPPHRAGPDSFVTAHLLAKMLESHRVSDLVRFTVEPRIYSVCPLTKHKGQRWEDIPADYLRWITNAADMDNDLKHAARSEMERRKAPRP